MGRIDGGRDRAVRARRDVLVTGTYDTDIITDAGTTDDRDFDGPYARLHHTMNKPRPVRDAFARPPERFTDGLVKALDDRGAFRRHGVGPGCVDAVGCPAGCCRPRGMHHMSRLVMGIPRQGAMRDGACPLTTAQRAMVLRREGPSRSRCCTISVADDAAFAAQSTHLHESASNG